MAPQPLVSVIVPGKDVEDYVAEALTSLTRQMSDPHDLEVIVVDDGSSDSTRRVVAWFESQLPNLVILSNSEPRGLASARNQGLAMASGRYVAYLDADDWLAPGHIAQMADAMGALGVNFIRTDHTTVAGRVRRLKRAPQAARNQVLEPRKSILPVWESTMVDYPYAWAGIFDRTLAKDGLLDFPDGFHTAEDRPWIWRLFLEAKSYAVTDSPGICYRRDAPNSLTSTYDRRQLDILRALRQAFDLVEADHDAGLYMPKLTRMSLALIAHHVARSERMELSVRRELRDGSLNLFMSIPQDVLVSEMRAMTPKRLKVLDGCLPDLGRGKRALRLGEGES